MPSNQYEPLMDAVANVGPISITVEAIHVRAPCCTRHLVKDMLVLAGFGSTSALVSSP